jgi:hexosaminidase
MTRPRMFCISLFVLGLFNTAAAQEPAIALIPRPALCEQRAGTFTLGRQTKILFSQGDEQFKSVAAYLADRLGKGTGYALRAEPAEQGAAAHGAILLTTAGAAASLGDEGYELTVSPEGIVLRAVKPAGVFYGVQTLLQLLPPAIESPRSVQGIAWRVSCVRVEDRPRFAWRGMHLDVARHFFDKQFVKRYIEYLAACKINVFHLYLTDDQGWRIEIKKYPKLAEISAWRKATLKHYFDGQGDQQRHGGYYSQDDIREIVAYARQRFITVVPGISMPGHSQAALAAYPELSSTGGPFEVGTAWGISKEVMDPGKEEVFRFVEDVLGEVIELFPSRYIHCGGDEVPRDRWKQSPQAQARMQREGLKNVDELQRYFTQRVQRFLKSKGRVLVGWDEILQEGLAPDALIMAWRGEAR